MSTLIDIGTAAARYSGTRILWGDVREILRVADSRQGLSDAELQSELRDALSGTRAGAEVDEHAVGSWFEGITARRLSRRMLHDIGLAVEAFNRAPADLDPGARLYPEQVRAAVALARQFVVQMDTGEGKTYAILPAAFALACQERQVVIVCANPYLAWRDAHRTRRFWNFVGIDPGLYAHYQSPVAQWESPVVYTTLDALMARQLDDDIASERKTAGVSYGAAILDEADAVLLDQANQEYTLVLPVQTSGFDWSFAIRFASELIADQDIDVDRQQLSARLSVAGETKLRESLLKEARVENPYLLTRFAVESAYVATRIVQQDVDYVNLDNRVLAVDRLTGKLLTNMTPYWLPPLEFVLGRPPRHTTIRLHGEHAAVCLRYFRHLSGLSGTVVDDALEYLFDYRLPTHVIPPRNKRNGRVDDDVVLRTRREAHRRVVRDTLAAVNAGRPVLVGTQTIADAEEIRDLLDAEHDAGMRVHCLTGRNDQQAAEIFSKGGDVGSVIVATQLAGRGVDIRLSDEARLHGGMALLGVGHAFDLRHDRQLLGRVGRQGDPFTARFICSMDDPLFRAFGSQRIQGLMDRFGHEEDEELESGFITRSVRSAQHRWRAQGFFARRASQLRIQAEHVLRTSALDWFERLQSPATDLQEDSLSDTFVAEVVGRFVRAAFEPVRTKGRAIDRAEAIGVIERIHRDLSWPDTLQRLVPLDVEGRDHSSAIHVLTDKLRAALETVGRSRRESIAEFEQWARVDLLFDAVEDLRRGLELLDTWRNGAEEQGRSSEFAFGGVPTGPTNLLNGETSLEQAEEDVEGATGRIESEITVERDEGATPANLEAVASGVVERRRSDPESAEIAQQLLDLHERTQSAMQAEELSADGIVAVNRVLFALCTSLGREELLSAIDHRNGTVLRESLNLLLVRGQAAIRHHEPDLDKWQQSVSLRSRSPRQTASWVLRLAWIEFLDERDRIEARIRASSYNALDHFRVLSDRIAHEWERQEGQLPARLLAALLRVDTPTHLDPVFSLSQMASPGTPSASIPEWEVWKKHEAPQLPTEARDPGSHSRHLIDQFVSAYDGQLNADFSATHLRRLLDDFLLRHPLSTLRTTTAIQSALEAWWLLEAERGVARKRRQLHRQWLRHFLIFLRARDEVAPLPGFRVRAATLVINAVRSIRELNTLVPALVMVLVVAGFIGLTAAFDVGVHRQLSGFWLQVDRALFGGLLTRGELSAFAFAGPFVVSTLGSALGLGTVYTNPLLRNGCAALQVAFLWWIIEWSSSSGAIGVAGAVGAAVVGFTLLSIIRNSCGYLEASAGIWVPAYWLTGATLAVFLPGLFEDSSASIAQRLAAFLLLVAAVAWRRLNTREVSLVSGRIKDQTSGPRVEELPTTVSVSGSTGVLPHLFALLFGWAMWDLFATVLEGRANRLAVAAWIAAAAYAIVVAGWTIATLTRRLSLRLWQQKLNSDRLDLPGGAGVEALGGMLLRARRALLTRELLFQLVALVSALLIFGLPAVTGFPVCLLLLFAVNLLADVGGTSVTQSVRFFLQRTPYVVTELDLKELSEPNEPMTFRARMRAMAENRLIRTVTILILIAKIALVALKFWKFWHP